MKEFIEEVNEELRWERGLKFWKQYGAMIIGGVVAFFLCLSGWVYWDYRQEQSLIKVAKAYEDALLVAERGEIEKSIEMLGTLSAETDNGYRFLSQLKIAGLGSKEDQKNGELYEKLAQDPKLEQNFRDLATVLRALQQVDHVRPIEIAETLRLIASGMGPWRASAAEILGLLLVKAGNVPKAIEVYDNLSKDDAATPGIRVRAQAMLDFLKN